jgi:hypothetical protein
LIKEAPKDFDKLDCTTRSVHAKEMGQLAKMAKKI